MTIRIDNHPIKNLIYRHKAEQIIRDTSGEERLLRLRQLQSTMRDDFERTEAREHRLPEVFQSFLQKFGDAGEKLGITAPNIPTDDASIRLWERDH